MVDRTRNVKKRQGLLYLGMSRYQFHAVYDFSSESDPVSGCIIAPSLS